MKKAIVLLSGGLDSATALGVALRDGYECYPISFDYAQRHKKELTYSARIVSHYARLGKAIYSLKVVTIGGLDFSTSALTSELEVPKDRDESTMAASIPSTYVPARNSIFLSIGTAFAEAIEADTVFTGFNAVDYSGYPDCRPEYVTAMEAALALGTKRGVMGNRISVQCPLIALSKVKIVELAVSLDVPIQYTWSCYVGQEKPCGKCDSCKIRASAFAQTHFADLALA